MSIVLSIYSHKGFREVTLPERGQTELRILIRKELFDLDADLTLLLEKAEKTESSWRLTPQGGLLLMNGKRYRSAPVSGGMQLEVEMRGGKRITVLSAEQRDPFSAYRKYPLSRLQQIRIGWNADNDIRYQDQGTEKDHYVSGQHCTLVLKNGHWELRDSSKNGTYVNFQRVYGSSVLNYGDSIRIMRLHIIFLGNMLAVNACDGLSVAISQLKGAEDINALATVGHERAGRKILFHRSPRNLQELHTEPIEIEAPPEPQDEREQPLAMQIGPALTMAIPMMLGSGLSALGNSSGNSAFVYMGMITAISSAVISAFWAMSNVRYNAKTRKQAENQRFERYSEYLIRMRDRIDKQYQENAATMRSCSLSADDCCGLNERSPLLWNRNDYYEDFLSVRLGVGDYPFQVPIVIPQERFTMINDALADKPRQLQENFRMLRNVPISVDLLQHRVVGVAGGENRKSAIAIAQAMVAQIAASNCYTDVKIAIAFDESSDIDRDAWNFAMWLPHVWSSDKKIRYMATNRSERGEIFHALTQILRNRKEEQEQTRSIKPRIVLFISDPVLLDGEAISHYVFDRDNDLGLSTVLLTGKPEELPNECEYVVECDGAFKGVYETRTGRNAGTAVKFDSVSPERLWKFSKMLGQIEVVDANQEGEIPNALTFLDMYGAEKPEDLHAEQRWRKANVIDSMKAMVGFSGSNKVCYLDINEKYHGPHGLVAGMTGSGKSETLQTYMLSLAVNYSPEDVGFFVIDYKGGGMANLFEDKLPHMIGSISNLSGNQVKRAMVSIKSENRRRQRIFRDHGVNSINGYTELYKKGDASEPVPHLIIIIDEFAELKREEPDFMKELISVAQIGRSLGVHMILSTQRPSGTVDDNIWANSKFHLCLQVQDRQDSMDMLHRVEAAYLRQPGRCYLQVGNDELFELFQSGWSGAQYDEELGGGSLLIAQMLSVTGKVDLAGNRAKAKRKAELQRRWIRQLLEVLQVAQSKSGISVSQPGFDFMDEQQFKDAFYQALQEVQPEFERSKFNDKRIRDFIALYLMTDGEPDERVSQIRELAASNNKQLPELRSKTQLEATVDYLRTVAEKQGVKKIRQLWLPVLPRQLYLDAMDPFRLTVFDGEHWPERPRSFHLSAVIGMADDPANQAQFPVSLDFAQGGHHLLIGTVSTGKSTLTQSLIYSLMATYPPDLLNIYCLDFSAQMLSVFADAPHVGGYLDDSSLENDSISKFFTLISSILDERRERFAGTTFADAMNHDGWTVPAILIALDNYGSFNQKTDEAYEAQIMRIIKEGGAYGVFLLATAGGISMQEMPSRLAESFRTGLALEMPDPFAYSDILHVLRPDVYPEARVKGRGLMIQDERILEFQTALAAPTKDGRIGVEAQPDDKNPAIETPERNDRIRAAVARMKAAWSGKAARGVPHIPEKPVRSEFVALDSYQAAISNKALLPVGYNYSDAETYSFDLSKNFAFLISGTRQSGKTVCMKNLMLACSERGEDVHIIEFGSQQFEFLAREKGWKRYADRESITDFFMWFMQECIERAGIKEELHMRNAPRQEYFEAGQKYTRINLFITTPAAFSDALSQLNQPVVISIDDDDEPAQEETEASGNADSAPVESGEATGKEDSAPAANEEASAESAEASGKADSAPAANEEAPGTEDSGTVESGEASENQDSAPEEPARLTGRGQLDLLANVCERGEGLNIFIFVETSDKDLDSNVKGYPWFAHLAAYQSGIRFGGHLERQSLLPFENVGYRDQERADPAGLGRIPAERQEEPVVRVVVPMIGA